MHETALRVLDLKFRYPGLPPGSPWTISVPRLELGRGEQMLLTAGSGRGKSTLLQLVAGLLDPDEGSVEVAGQRIHTLHGARRDLFRGRHIGMIFQTFNLLHGFTAAENVKIALMFSDLPRREHQDRALAVLARLGIDRPDAQTDRLSIGQQQRVAVARALVADPELVLADEPTASLDPANAAVAMDLIQEVCAERNAALLCVSHDPAMRDRFSRREALDELAAAGGRG